MCHMIMTWDVHLTSESGGCTAHPIQGGGAIPRVPKKMEVASSLHSMNMVEYLAHLRRDVIICENHINYYIISYTTT